MAAPENGELIFAPSPSTYSLADMGELDHDFDVSYKTGNAYLNPKKPLVTLVWKDLAVAVRVTSVVLLNYVGGRVSQGFYAVMGPSGSGKTTLLNTLACRLDRAVKVSGFMRINGKNFTRNDLKKIAAYVMQDDLMNAYMTVQETLVFAAELRLPRKLTNEERLERVAEVAEAMGVSHITEVIIGNALMKGVSGGERKRTAVAMELLTKPSLLFLDEPTSGLDSVMSLQLCTKLRALADTRTCAIVTTIHQPQSKIFRQFTNLLLLKKGTVMYQGTTQGAIDFFDYIGAPVPAKENPADHFMDAMSIPEISDKMSKAYFPPEVDLEENSDQPIIAIKRDPLPWMLQFLILVRRALKEQWRRRVQIFLQLSQSVIIAIMFATAFGPLKATNKMRQNRNSALWSCIVNQGIFGTLAAINSFPKERGLALRERASGMYCASAYFMAKTMSDLPTQIMAPVVFSLSMYFLVGFQLTAQKFFFFTAFMILTNVAACSLGLACSAVCRKVECSLVLLPMMYEICRLYGSFFLAPALVPRWLKWIDVLSYAKYGHIGIVINDFVGLEFTDYNKARPPIVGNLPNGEAWIKIQGYPGYVTRGDCAGILLVFIIGYRFIAFCGIRFLKY